MATRGAKVERSSVSEQTHELKYEARKEGTTAKKGSNKRAAVEKKLEGKK